jgi:asparagine synthase (glutamine-hydrolysing)
MCGIVGFYSPERADRLIQDLPAAVNALSHRGPDDSGQYFDNRTGVGLGQRRLSIIDLSQAGHQPMQSSNGSAVIVYNGEIYNFIKIRKQLIQTGCSFKSKSDTEVVLNAYLRWGPACLEYFIGMFSFAIWDFVKQRLFIARDRLGIKPLYYHINNKTLFFSSELKAMMAFRNFSRSTDEEALSLFMHFQYIPSPRTIFKATKKLLPGHYMIYGKDGLTIQEYWRQPNYSQNPALDSKTNERSLLEELDDKVTQAVSDRLISDVPLGALLSGGIDSSLVVAMMQKSNSTPVRTFSIGFSENKYNEAPWAGKVADYLGTDHTELYVSPSQALEIIPQLPDIYDEPFADASAVPTFLVSKLTSSYVKVALSGDGGDEQFAGYVRYWMTKAMADLFSKIPKTMKLPIAKLLSKIPADRLSQCYLPLRDYLPQKFQVENFQDKWQKLIMQLEQSDLSQLYRMTVCIWSQSDIKNLMNRKLPIGRYEELFQAINGWPAMSGLMHVDQQTYLPDCMLTKVDRASMAASIEVRVPLLDHRVVEFTSKMPEDYKYRNGTGKYLLKKLLARYLPKTLFERPKMGFGVPLDTWMRNELKELLLDYLSAERLKKEGRLNPRIVEKTLNEHFDGRLNHHHRLWAILMWQMWRERWLS